jgi:hypothetical protein
MCKWGRLVTTYLSEQYRTELLGVMICFSQVVLHPCQPTEQRIVWVIHLPVLQETCCHYFLVLKLLLVHNLFVGNVGTGTLR